VLNDLVQVGQLSGLKGAELVKGVVLTSDEWTAESGHLTAAQKLKRKEAVESYKGEIDALYKK
jgi:long-chain acyl-CoA synthetase